MARISQSIRHGKLIWVAREERKGKWVVVARADSEKELDEILNPKPKKATTTRKKKK